MNRRDLMDSEFKSALARAREVEQEYTCPNCGDKWGWDPEKRSCTSCGFTRLTAVKNFFARILAKIQKEN